MHHSFWSDLGAEYKGAFSRWQVGIVALTIVPALLGALLVPASDASSLVRLWTALATALVSLLLIAGGVLAFSLVRVPMRDYRYKHLQARLGQSCIDCAKDILRSLQLQSVAVVDPNGVPGPLDGSNPPGRLTVEIENASDVEIQRMTARYSRYCAQLVYQCATALYAGDHIGKEEREKLRQADPNLPVSPTESDRLETVLEMLQVARRLTEMGIRLGGRVYEGSRGEWDRPPGRG